MRTSFKSRQFLVFLLTGGCAALVNFCSRIVYDRWVDFSVAIVLAYLTGMVTAFILARQFVFKESTQALHRSALYFTLVNGVAALQTWVVSVVLAYYVLPLLGWSLYVKETAHAVGVVIPVFTSYIGHKHFSFK